MKNRSWIRYILIAADVLWVAFIFARSLKAADESTAESAWVLDLVRIILPSASMHFVRKLAHFTEYFILGALLFASMQIFGAKRLAMVLPAAGCMAVAVADELLQTLSPGRSCQVSDMLLDTAGGICGMLICALAVYLVRKARRH